MNRLFLLNLLRKQNFFFNIFKESNFGEYSIVTPGKVSPKRLVPDHISKPIYYENGEDYKVTSIDIKTSENIKSLRKSCKLAANILNDIVKLAKPGVTTDEIDERVHNLVIENGAYPSPLNYKHFPKSVCTSVNNVACHGIPDDRKLMSGDIVNVDVTVFLDGFHGDCSRTFLIGNVDAKGQELVDVTEVCLMEAINICKEGVAFKKIGKIIGEIASEYLFTPMPQFCGHGIGHYFHGPPDIFHHPCYSYPGEMRSGMVFTIEPVLSQGTDQIEMLEDNWTCITIDDSRTAQFEHTILVTNSGYEILTKPD